MNFCVFSRFFWFFREFLRFFGILATKPLLRRASLAQDGEPVEPREHRKHRETFDFAGQVARPCPFCSVGLRKIRRRGLRCASRGYARLRGLGGRKKLKIKREKMVLTHY